jgi:hypothetical protein
MREEKKSVSDIDYTFKILENESDSHRDIMKNRNKSMVNLKYWMKKTIESWENTERLQ